MVPSSALARKAALDAKKDIKVPYALYDSGWLNSMQCPRNYPLLPSIVVTIY